VFFYPFISSYSRDIFILIRKILISKPKLSILGTNRQQSNYFQVSAMKIREKSTSYKTSPQKFTYQDYLNLPDDGKRYEVINGELIIVAAPNTLHQIASGNLEFALRTFLTKHKIGKIFDAPIDVVLSDNNVVQPDILFIAKNNYHIITEKNISGAPDLIIEILSPTTAYYDLFE